MYLKSFWCQLGDSGLANICFGDSTSSSQEYCISHHQISNWRRQFFKYKTLFCSYSLYEWSVLKINMCKSLKNNYLINSCFSLLLLHHYNYTILPINPFLHRHLNLPTMTSLTQSAFSWQFSVIRQSSSAHVVPSPVYPEVHTHPYLWFISS